MNTIKLHYEVVSPSDLGDQVLFSAETLVDVLRLLDSELRKKPKFPISVIKKTAVKEVLNQFPGTKVHSGLKDDPSNYE